jgi:hypothetical protein
MSIDPFALITATSFIDSNGLKWSPWAFNGETIQKVVSAHGHTFVLTTAGNLYGYGNNTLGQLGLVYNLDVTLPQQVNDVIYLVGAVCSKGYWNYYPSDASVRHVTTRAAFYATGCPFQLVFPNGQCLGATEGPVGCSVDDPDQWWFKTVDVSTDSTTGLSLIRHLSTTTCLFGNASRRADDASCPFEWTVSGSSVSNALAQLTMQAASCSSGVTWLVEPTLRLCLSFPLNAYEPGYVNCSLTDTNQGFTVNLKSNSLYSVTLPRFGGECVSSTAFTFKVLDIDTRATQTLAIINSPNNYGSVFWIWGQGNTLSTVQGYLSDSTNFQTISPVNISLGNNYVLISGVSGYPGSYQAGVWIGQDTVLLPLFVGAGATPPDNDTYIPVSMSSDEVYSVFVFANGTSVVFYPPCYNNGQVLCAFLWQGATFDIDNVRMSELDSSWILWGPTFAQTSFQGFSVNLDGDTFITAVTDGVNAVALTSQGTLFINDQTTSITQCSFTDCTRQFQTIWGGSTSFTMADSVTGLSVSPMVYQFNGTAYCQYSRSLFQQQYIEKVVCGSQGICYGLSRTGALFEWQDCSFTMRVSGTYTDVAPDGSALLSTGQLSTGSPLLPCTAVQIQSGDDLDVILCSNGVVMTWTFENPTPVAVSLPQAATSIVAGGSSVFAFMSNGDLYAWGPNQYNQLGFSGSTTIPFKVPIESGVSFVEVSCNQNWTAFLVSSTSTGLHQVRLGGYGVLGSSPVPITVVPCQDFEATITVYDRTQGAACEAAILSAMASQFYYPAVPLSYMWAYAYGLVQQVFPTVAGSCPDLAQYTFCGVQSIVNVQLTTDIPGMAAQTSDGSIYYVGNLQLDANMTADVWISNVFSATAPAQELCGAQYNVIADGPCEWGVSSWQCFQWLWTQNGCDGLVQNIWQQNLPYVSTVSEAQALVQACV